MVKHTTINVDIRMELVGIRLDKRRLLEVHVVIEILEAYPVV